MTLEPGATTTACGEDIVHVGCIGDAGGSWGGCGRSFPTQCLLWPWVANTRPCMDLVSQLFGSSPCGLKHDAVDFGENYMALSIDSG